MSIQGGTDRLKRIMKIFKTDEALQIITPYIPDNPIIVEVGAFHGQDTIRMATYWPDSTIHAFEPVPELFDKLVENTHHLPNIICHQLALGITDGTTSLHLMRKNTKPDVVSQASSVLKPVDDGQAHPRMTHDKTITIPSITLDSWATQHKITHIDLLWLDVQGFELAILQHAPKILPHIRVMYTEVNFVQRYYQQPTYDELRTFLEQHNFILVALDTPLPTHRRFGNALFVHQSLV